LGCAPGVFYDRASTILGSLYLCGNMELKKQIFLLIFIVQCGLLCPGTLPAQCSICTKTAQQMGEKPAKALNAGIIYLAVTPLAIFGYIGWRWWKNNHE
jgi:hypothetical protein